MKTIDDSYCITKLVAISIDSTIILMKNKYWSFGCDEAQHLLFLQSSPWPLDWKGYF